MDLIYTDENRKDIGIVKNYEFDIAYGRDENNFQLTVPYNSNEEDKQGINALVKHGVIYVDTQTELGGIIDDYGDDTSKEIVTYIGRSWHGILNSFIIEPDVGSDYLILSGDANAVIGNLISRLGITDMFQASSESSGITISNYQIERYVEAYTGIRKMLQSVGAKLKFVWDGAKVILSAAPSIDYSKTADYNASQFQFKTLKHYSNVNHLICLGKGDLKNRTVIHLYTDENGNLSNSKVMTGINEMTAKFDYPSVESVDALKSKGIEKLAEYWKRDSININFDSTSDVYEIGDIVGATNSRTNINVSEYITKKEIKIGGGDISIVCRIGEK